MSRANKLQQSCRIQDQQEKSVFYIHTHTYMQSIICKGIKETISFTIASKRIKYCEINLTKEVKDLYTENYQKWLIKKLKNT